MIAEKGTIAKKGFIGIIYEYFGMFISSLSGLIGYIILIRYLSKDDYGTYSVFKSAFSFVFLFISLGIPHVFQRYIPEFLQNNEKGKIVILIKNAFRSFSIFILLILTILYFGRTFLFDILNLNYSFELFILFLLGLVSEAFCRIFNMVLHSTFMQKQFNLSQAVFFVIKLLLFILVSHFDLGLHGIILSFITANLIWFVIKIIFIREFLFSREKLPIPFSRMLKFGMFKYFNDLGMIILDVLLDIILISMIMGKKFAGEYSFAVSIIAMIVAWYPGKLGIQVIIPVFVQQYTKNKDTEQLSTLLFRMIKAVSFVALPVMVLTVIFSEQIIGNIFNKEYLNTSNIFIFGMITFSIYHIFQPGFNAVLTTLEKANILFYSRLFTFYNLIMDIILIKYCGIFGAIVATGTTLIFIVIFQAFFITKYIRLELPYRSFLKIILNLIPAAILLYFVRAISNNLILTVVFLVAGMLIYFGICLINKIFTEEERNFFNYIIGKKVFKF